MLPPIFAALAANATVTSIIGQPPRAYRHGRAPQQTSRPYVTWHLVGSSPENVLDDVPDIDRQTVQIDCWHPEDLGVEALAVAVRDCIEPVAHMISLPINEREAETKLFRIAMQFDWFLGRTLSASSP